MTNANATPTTRSFQYTVKHRENDNVGAVDYTVTETITEEGGGLRIVTRAQGICEGERVNETAEKFWADVTMERAAAYRLSHGYTEIRRLAK